ncbi:NADPH2 dehydrogenase [Fusarium mexicanum]|uniref:NADPH2 dehydrogenase n=1 Tax=Fusarium mexicanum TaxID=751941 RepID=A0A8H5JI26_9HYPO|nr:NADPH2 dehydrogenase [Fusarium mexicanum]
MRLSLWSDFTDNGMDDPTLNFIYIIQQLCTLKIEFLDLIEARFRGNDDADCGDDDDVFFAVHAWGKEGPVMSSRGFNGESARKAVDEIYKDYKLAIVFGRHWTSNPDLPYRIKANISCQISLREPKLNTSGLLTLRRLSSRLKGHDHQARLSSISKS